MPLIKQQQAICFLRLAKDYVGCHALSSPGSWHSLASITHLLWMNR